jgi:hypothetical protein
MSKRALETVSPSLPLCMTLNDLAGAEPSPATQTMPDELREMLTRQSGLLVRSDTELAVEVVRSGTSPINSRLWSVS